MPKARNLLTAISVLLCLGMLAVYGVLWWLTATASVSTHGDVDLGAGNIEVPTVRTEPASSDSPLTNHLIDDWASKGFLDWQLEGKVTMPRVLVAKLSAGKEVEAVNDYLQKAHVRGNVGSTSYFHPEGDYDFTLAGLNLILFTFGDSPELLYPKTVEHIVHVLMTEAGGEPVEFTPRILGLPLRDTENHILMTEGSRFLKNRWLRMHGNLNPEFDNELNGLEDFLLEHLSHMERAGFHEYNSRPYIGYTLTALLNLQSFAGGQVSAAATRILDRANWEYALGSLNLRRFPPFRRQPRRAFDTDLDGDYHTAMVKAWMSLREATANSFQIRSGDHQALWVPFTSYRLPDKTAQWIEAKPSEYFVRFGHGADGSPEIYSGSPKFLITAGGVAQDRFEQAVARPTTLMLNDGALDLSELLQISGEGEDYRGWNNTGVHHRFAVGDRVTVPSGWSPIAVKGDVRVYDQAEQIIVVYDAVDVAMFYLPESRNPQSALEQFFERNSAEQLPHRFRDFQGGTIEYELAAKPNRWVITSIDDQKSDRRFAEWSLMSGLLNIEP